MAQTTAGLSSVNGVVEFVPLQTLQNGGASAAQKNIVVDSTTGMIAGDTLEYMLIGGVIQQNVIDTVTNGTDLVMVDNVGTGGIADNELVSKVVLMSGTANSVSVSGGNRASGEAFTASGDAPLLTHGKREPFEITVRGVYTETATAQEFYETLHAVYASGAGCGVRWSPTAYTVAGQKRFWTTDTLGAYIDIVPITAWNFPSLDFSSGDPIMCEFTVRSSNIGTTDYS